eukprot:m.140657 g.140657  ORF g.140657 m.140657 type:complete len:142 (-) comp22814_c0_seq1:48-473(-)
MPVFFPFRLNHMLLRTFFDPFDTRGEDPAPAPAPAAGSTSSLLSLRRPHFFAFAWPRGEPTVGGEVTRFGTESFFGIRKEAVPVVLSDAVLCCHVDHDHGSTPLRPMLLTAQAASCAPSSVLDASLSTPPSHLTGYSSNLY